MFCPTQNIPHHSASKTFTYYVGHAKLTPNKPLSKNCGAQLSSIWNLPPRKMASRARSSPWQVRIQCLVSCYGQNKVDPCLTAGQGMPYDSFPCISLCRQMVGQYSCPHHSTTPRHHYCTYGVSTPDISACSLCSSGTMAMLCTDTDTNKIRLIGRSRSDKMFCYLHTQAYPIMHNIAPLMFNHGLFVLIPNSPHDNFIQALLI